MPIAYFSLVALEFFAAIFMAAWGIVDIEAAADAIPVFAIASTLLCTALAVLGVFFAPTATAKTEGTSA